MKAFYLQRKGLKFATELGRIPRPRPRDHEVLIKVENAGVQPIAWQSIPRLRLLPTDKLLLGREVAGTIVEVGYRAARFLPGARAYALAPVFGGCLAEYVRLPEHLVVPIPDGVSTVQAASTPLAGVQAWQALKAAKLQAGANLLVCGANNAASLAAIQLGKALQTYVCAIDTDDQTDLLKHYGADYTITLNGNPNRIRCRQRFDAIIDFSGTHQPGMLARFLEPDGTLITSTPHPHFGLLHHLLPGRKKGLQSISLKPEAMDLLEVSEFLAQGKLRNVVDQVFGLDEVEKAYRYSESLHSYGRVIVAA